jgi:hypothetical protein
MRSDAVQTAVDTLADAVKWDEFVVETEAAFRVCTPPNSCAAGEKTFRNILLSASKHCIPAGRRQNFVPGLTSGGC